MFPFFRPAQVSERRVTLYNQIRLFKSKLTNFTEQKCLIFPIFAIYHNIKKRIEVFFKRIHFNFSEELLQ